MIALALYQPQQAGNCGTIIRLAACMGVPLHIIHPCGFAFSRAALKRYGMDYLEIANILEHDNWHAFIEASTGMRIILATTHATDIYTNFVFGGRDIILFGQESAGVPSNIHQSVHSRVKIAMQPAARSLNIAVSCGMIIGEALRQTCIGAR